MGGTYGEKIVDPGKSLLVKIFDTIKMSMQDPKMMAG